MQNAFLHVRHQRACVDAITVDIADTARSGGVATVSYDKAVGRADRATAGSAASGLVVDRVFNVPSSISGASSSTFHNYRLERRREADRLDRLEREAVERRAEDEFRERIERNKLEDERAHQRRVEKRKRKRERPREAKAARVEAAPAAVEETLDEAAALREVLGLGPDDPLPEGLLSVAE